MSDSSNSWVGDQRTLGELLLEGLRKCEADRNRPLMPRGPVLVPPAVFERAVEAGLIDEHGRLK